jgi:hypothetical protein
VVVVHGLAYTDPPAGVGKVRLVRNAASTAGTAVLDLVVAAPATGYSVALNLPVDTTRVQANSSLMAAGSALNPGSSPAAFKAVLPSQGPLAGVLVSALSQKAAGTGAVATNAALTAGQVLYTLRLDAKPGAPAGVAFDGAALAARFRASLRDRLGQEVVAQGDFAIGKLEVK